MKTEKSGLKFFTSGSHETLEFIVLARKEEIANAGTDADKYKRLSQNSWSKEAGRGNCSFYKTPGTSL